MLPEKWRGKAFPCGRAAVSADPFERGHAPRLCRNLPPN